MNAISYCPGVETVFPTEEEEDSDDEDIAEEEEIGPSICRVLKQDDLPNLLQNKTALVYLSQLTSLARKKVDCGCKVKGCAERIEISVHHIGSAVYLKRVLQNLYHGYYCVLFYILKH